MPIHFKTFSLGKLVAFFCMGSGIILASYGLFSPSFSNPNLQPGAFVDRLPVPFFLVNLGSVDIPIQVDHFLVFQNYQVTPYPFTPTENP